MAACLITITGTSGEVRIDYLDGIISKHVTSGIGTMYLEDTYTNVTYTTISGDAIASSLCFTITALPYNYYMLSWRGICSEGYTIVKAILGIVEYTIPDTEFPISKENLIMNINNASIPEFKIVGYKYNYNGIMPISNIRISYIVRTLGTEIPYLKVRDLTNETSLYIKGTSSIELPVGFTAIEVCENIIFP